MAEHLLHGAQVGPVFQKVRGKGMAQRVRRDLLGDARLAGVLLDDLPEPLPREAPAVVVDEQGLFPLAAQQHRPGPLDVPARGVDGDPAEGDDPLLRSLAHALEVGHVQIDVVQVQRHQLRHAQTRRVQQLQHRLVAQAGRRARIGHRQQALHFLHRQHLGQALLQFGRLEVDRRVLVNEAFAEQEVEKRPDRRQVARDGRRGLPLLLQVQEKAHNVRPRRLLDALDALFLQVRGKGRQILAVRDQRVGRQPPFDAEVVDELVDQRLHRSSKTPLCCIVQGFHAIPPFHTRSRESSFSAAPFFFLLLNGTLRSMASLCRPQTRRDARSAGRRHSP